MLASFESWRSAGRSLLKTDQYQLANRMRMLAPLRIGATSLMGSSTEVNQRMLDGSPKI